jgi:alkyldihydroxyacetonephosphate synthase
MQHAFTPPWLDGPPPPGSWRSLFKWGDPARSSHPGPRFYHQLKEAFGLGDDDFRVPSLAGLERAEARRPPGLAESVLADLEALLGPGNVCTDDHSRLAAAYGKGMFDLLRLRRGIAEHLPDAVLHPRDRHDLVRIVEYCVRHGIPMTARGAGTSVTRATECPAGGVSLDLRTHMDKIVRFNETSQSITVQPGMYGPRLERILNRAPELLGAARRYTCGHFPQSFEHSTVGGWAATRGAGQNSTYFGKIEDLVLAQEYVTPAGVIRTGEHPAAATGPDTDQILLGSEGAFGVLAEATLRVFRHQPENQLRYSYLFRDWPAALDAAREILQGQFGLPSVFRLSDPAETEWAFGLYGLDRSPLDALARRLGFRPGARCLLLGSAEGERGYARNVRRQVARVCRGRGAFPTTGLVTRAWEHGRFRDPYLRDDLLDFGILVDTLECAVTWDGLERVRRGVREACSARPRTLCLTHLSHAYPQGASLYFIFMTKMDCLEEYLAFQGSLLDAIRRQGAAMSHHHGIGRMTAPWLEGQVGPAQMDLFRAIKRHFDPQGLMNPGGTLGLDLPGPDDSNKNYE